MKNIKIFLSVAIFLMSSLVASADVDSTQVVEKKEKFNATEFIIHHVLDDHEWHLWGEGDEAMHFPLPIILVDGGLQVFSSDQFSEDKTFGEQEYVLTADGKYGMHHQHIYKTENGDLQFDEAGDVSNASVLDLSITRNVASMLLSVFLLVLLFGTAAKSYKKRGVDSAPKGLQSFLEPLVLYVRDEIARPNIGEKKYARYMPFLLTIFFFIWLNNLMGLIPVFPGASNLTGNIAFTFVLATITYLVTTFSGNKDYWKHLLMPPVPWPLWFIMIPIEIVGTLTKPFALMIRLFANITAGHIVVLAFICIIFIKESAGWAALSVPMALFISVLELLVAFLQAFIFTMLTALFIGSAVEEHAHH